MGGAKGPKCVSAAAIVAFVMLSYWFLASAILLLAIGSSSTCCPWVGTFDGAQLWCNGLAGYMDIWMYIRGATRGSFDLKDLRRATWTPDVVLLVCSMHSTVVKYALVLVVVL
jgi:hypothetical protein